MTFDKGKNKGKKIRLTKAMVLKAVKKVKAKGKFDYERFVTDFKMVE